MAPPENSTRSSLDYSGIVEDLNRYLRLRTNPVGMKRFRTVAELEAVPKLRRPPAKVTLDQLVGQSRLMGLTLGVTADELAGAQCAVPVGLMPRGKDWLNSDLMAGVWFETPADAAAHQQAMDCGPEGYAGLAVSPLSAGRLDPPDVVLVYATPAQMILFINGLQYSGYRKLTFTVVGESACADSWGRALATGEPSLSLPCYAERAFGGVAEDELLMALPPGFLPKVVAGLAALSRNGLRYPIPPLGPQADPMPILKRSYGDRF